MQIIKDKIQSIMDIFTLFNKKEFRQKGKMI